MLWKHKTVKKKKRGKNNEKEMKDNKKSGQKYQDNEDEAEVIIK